MRFSSRKVVAPRIVQEDRAVWPYWLIVMLLAAAVAGWFAYDYGRKTAGLDTSSFEKQEDTLRQDLAGMKFRLDALRLQAASCQRDAQIDREAVEQAKKELQAIQQEKADLRREVDLLNGLLSDKSLKAVLELEKLSIKALDKEQKYRLTFTLVHLSKVGGKVEGFASLEISGKKAGEELTLKLRDIVQPANTKLKLGFKNFQKIEVDVKLPEAFEPESIRIFTDTDGKNLETFEQTVPWLVE
jgi:hypothetical protein